MRWRASARRYDPKWHIADPICTFIFATMVLATTPGIIRQALEILLNFNPMNEETHDDLLA